MSEFLIARVLITVLLIVAAALPRADAKIQWKTKPEPVKVVKENENVKLECEFEDVTSAGRQPSSPAPYFVIWYKDGSNQNVLALNDQLANLNATNYEISGKYNLIIKNVSRNDSGQYTCQLFQSSDLVATINLTVLVPPKYAKLSVRQAPNAYNKGFLVENDFINLECCTNGDANPQPSFEWIKLPRHRIPSPHSRAKSLLAARADLELLNPQLLSAQERPNYASQGRICNSLQLNMSRQDNSYMYKCMVTNEALANKLTIEDNLMLTVEYKPEVRVHLADAPHIQNKLSLIENSSVRLFCNATALPNAVSYEWFVDGIPLREFKTETLVLSKLLKSQAGNYSCRCTNRHGSSTSSFSLDIIYAQILPANKSSEVLSSGPGSSSGVVYTTSVENTSVMLSCEIKANPMIENVVWHYYQVNKQNQVVNKVMLSNWISSINTVLNETEKRYYSQLNLNNLTANHTGFYSCSINFLLIDNLNQTKVVNSNATYFLQVQYAPVVRPLRRSVYGNSFDQVEMSCQVRSNPQSVFSWYFGNKELFSSYKHNITNVVYKIISRSSAVEDVDNVHFYRSTLVINGITQFDYGNYTCRASNAIGETDQNIQLLRKQKPDTPTEFRIVETTANSVHLSWLSGSNGGENVTYVINVNRVYNVTTITDVVDEEEEEAGGAESKYRQIELKGLQPVQFYELKILAVNSLGTSEFSPTLTTRTLKASYLPEKIPTIQHAQFNEIREAICFDLEPTADYILNNYIANQQLKELMIRVEVKPNEELLTAAQELFRFNKTINLITDRNVVVEPRQKIGGLDASSTLSTPFSTIFSTLTSSPFRRTEEPAPQRQLPAPVVKTFYVNSQKLKYGQNCILYSQLIDIDAQSKNSSNANAQSRRKSVFSLFGEQASHEETASGVMNTKSNFLQLDTLSRNFFDFKRLHRVNISICFANDSSICAEKSSVSDFNADFSTYITLIAIGCSAILIFITLLIASLCCCCCRRRKQKQGKNDINPKLVIKSFPIVNAQKSFDLVSDDSAKSSQQHILNGSNSGTDSSNSSHVGINLNRSSDKNFFTNQSNFIEQHMYDPNKYLTSTYKLDYGLGANQNTSSIATVESDVSSSASLENKTSTIASNKASPFTLLNDNTSYFQTLNGNYGQTAAVSNKPPMHHGSLGGKTQPQTLVYSGANSIYIKAYQTQVQVPPSAKSTSQRQFSNGSSQHSESPESGYSTPVNNHHSNKKLVYEVIV